MPHYVVFHKGHEKTESRTLCDSLEAAERQACIHVLESLTETDWDPREQGGQLERVQEVIKSIGEGNYSDAIGWAREIFSDEGLHEVISLECVDEPSAGMAATSTDIPLWERYTVFVKAFNEGTSEEDEGDKDEEVDDEADDGDSSESEAG